MSTEQVSDVFERRTIHSHFLTVLLSNRRVKADEKTEHHLNPLKVLHCVDELMAEDSIIVADGGDFVGSAAYIMRPRGPMRWLDPGLLPAYLSEHTHLIISDFFRHAEFWALLISQQGPLVHWVLGEDLPLEPNYAGQNLR